MCKALNERLALAIRKKVLANKRKTQNESELLADQEVEIKRVVEEFNRLKQETLESSKVLM